MRLVVFALVCACACNPSPRTRWPLVTFAEQSGFVKTGRYDEVATLCQNFERTYERVRCRRIGSTDQGREIFAILVERVRGAPWIYIEGGIHAGEIDGKDAGFWFLRDLLDGKVARGALDPTQHIVRRRETACEHEVMRNFAWHCVAARSERVRCRFVKRASTHRRQRVEQALVKERVREAQVNAAVVDEQTLAHCFIETIESVFG